MIAHADLGLLGEEWAAERAGKHARVDLLAVGDEGVARQRVVVLPTRQLTDASDRAVHRAQSAEPSPCPQIMRSW